MCVGMYCMYQQAKQSSTELRSLPKKFLDKFTAASSFLADDQAAAPKPHFFRKSIHPGPTSAAWDLDNVNQGIACISSQRGVLMGMAVRNQGLPYHCHLDFTSHICPIREPPIEPAPLRQRKTTRCIIGIMTANDSCDEPYPERIAGHPHFPRPILNATGSRSERRSACRHHMVVFHHLNSLSPFPCHTLACTDSSQNT